MNNLIFDCNYILYKNVHSLHKMNRLYGDLWTALDNNIFKYASMNKWENIIIVSDSNKKSWRSKYLTKYKTHRVKNNDIDWDWVFNTYNEWKESHKNDWHILELDHIEGDDWIAALSWVMNKNGKSNVVISSDQDLLQLVNYKIKKNKSWMNIQIVDTLGKEFIYLPIGWQIWAKECEDNTNTDIFNLDNSLYNYEFFKRIVKNYENKEINSYGEFFTKLVMGDKSDNVDSIYQTLTKTGKIQNLGKASAKKIWDFYKSNFDIHFDTTSDEFKDEIILCLENIKKLQLSTSQKNNVMNNIQNNLKVMELNHIHYPEWVIELIVEKLKKIKM